MKLSEILMSCEVVYEDEDGNILSESAVRQYKRTPGTNKITRKFRCSAGPKKGKLVSKPGDCSHRPDPKRKRIGRKVMRRKKAMIMRKAKITKRKSISKTLARMNARAMGKGGTHQS